MVEIRSEEKSMYDLLKSLSLTSINGYNFEKTLTGGQMSCAAVYGNERDERIVYKFLIQPRNKEELQRFKREAKTLNRLRVFAYAKFMVLALSDVENKEGFPVYYFKMEFIEGASLSEVIEKEPLPWSPEKATEYLLRVVAAILPAPVAGFVHRDLHAGNIMVCDKLQSGSFGERDYDPGIRLVDFGLATDWWQNFIGKLGTEDKLRHIGAVSCWSPEYLNSPDKVGVVHDVWGLGSLYFRMLTNEWAYEATSFGSYYDRVTRGEFKSELLDELRISAFPQHLLKRMFDVDQDKRIQAINIGRMCCDYLDGTFSKVERHDNLLKSYLRFDGDLWGCSRCSGITPGKTRCTRCGFPSSGFLPLSYVIDKILNST
jgi:serine/threonine protein kinase